MLPPPTTIITPTLYIGIILIQYRCGSRWIKISFSFFFFYYQIDLLGMPTNNKIEQNKQVEVHKNWIYFFAMIMMMMLMMIMVIIFYRCLYISLSHRLQPIIENLFLLFKLGKEKNVRLAKKKWSLKRYSSSICFIMFDVFVIPHYKYRLSQKNRCCAACRCYGPVPDNLSCLVLCCLNLFSVSFLSFFSEQQMRELAMRTLKKKYRRRQQQDWFVHWRLVRTKWTLSKLAYKIFCHHHCHHHPRNIDITTTGCFHL